MQKNPIQNLLGNVKFLNPDDLALASLRRLGFSGFGDAPVADQAGEFVSAARSVEQELMEQITAGEAVGVETVLSTDKYRAVVEMTKRLGGAVHLVYIALASSDLAVQRVDLRVRKGGHGVPHEKIRERWRRSLDQLEWFLSRSDEFWVIDNSASDQNVAVKLIGSGLDGKTTFISEPCFPEMRSVLRKLSPIQ